MKKLSLAYLFLPILSPFFYATDSEETSEERTIRLYFLYQQKNICGYKYDPLGPQMEREDNYISTKIGPQTTYKQLKEKLYNSFGLKLEPLPQPLSATETRAPEAEKKLTIFRNIAGYPFFEYEKLSFLNTELSSKDYENIEEKEEQKIEDDYLLVIISEGSSASTIQQLVKKNYEEQQHKKRKKRESKSSEELTSSEFCFDLQGEESDKTTNDKTTNDKKMIYALGLGSLLGIVVAAAYYFVVKKKKELTASEEVEVDDEDDEDDEW